MTKMTRRQALGCSAAVAITPLAASPGMAAETCNTKSILIAPSGPISDGSAIPIGVMIPSCRLDQKDHPKTLLKSLQIDLKLEDAVIASVVLEGLALGSDVAISTRLKVAYNKDKPAALKLTVDAKPTYGKPPPPAGTAAPAAPATDDAVPGDAISDSAILTVGPGGCPSSAVGTMRVSVQPVLPAKGSTVRIKSLVPPTYDEKGAVLALDKVSAKLDGNATATVTIKDPKSFADEFFLQFDVKPVARVPLSLEWSYLGGSKLSLATYVAMKPDAPTTAK